jgi:hypothetical protein
VETILERKTRHEPLINKAVCRQTKTQTSQLDHNHPTCVYFTKLAGTMTRKAMTLMYNIIQILFIIISSKIKPPQIHCFLIWSGN